MQKTEVWRNGMETTEREGLDSMACMEGQVDWRAGRAEKSKPGVEDLRSTACRTGWGGMNGAEADGGL